MGVEGTVLTLVLAAIALLILTAAGLVVAQTSELYQSRSRPAVATRSTPAESAEALLREVLDEREYQQLMMRGYLDVRSPHYAERIYRIPGYLGLVRVYEHGVAVRELCVQPVEPLPSADVVAMHKLMIQGNEQEYLALARQFSSVYPNQRYRP